MYTGRSSGFSSFFVSCLPGRSANSLPTIPQPQWLQYESETITQSKSYSSESARDFHPASLPRNPFRDGVFTPSCDIYVSSATPPRRRFCDAKLLIPRNISKKFFSPPSLGPIKSHLTIMRLFVVVACQQIAVLRSSVAEWRGDVPVCVVILESALLAHTL